MHDKLTQVEQIRAERLQPEHSALHHAPSVQQRNTISSRRREAKHWVPFIILMIVLIFSLPKNKDGKRAPAQIWSARAEWPHNVVDYIQNHHTDVFYNLISNVIISSVAHLHHGALKGEKTPCCSFCKSTENQRQISDRQKLRPGTRNVSKISDNY